MSGCGNYAENVWRKGKCANCFRSREEHATDSKVKDGGMQKENSTGFKKATNGINGHSRDDLKLRKEMSDDRGDNSIKAKPTEETKSSKSVSKYPIRHSTDKTGKSHLENARENTRSEEGKESSSIADKPKPIPRPRARGFSRGSSSSQEDILNLRPSSAASACSDCSRSSSTLDDREHLGENFETPKLEAGTCECTDTKDAERSLNELNSNSDRSQPTQSIGDLGTIANSKGANYQTRNGRPNNVRNSAGGLKNSTSTGKTNLKDLTAENMDEIEDGDGVYMPMKNNVCEVITGDKETELSADGKRPATDRILKQSLSEYVDDRDTEDASAKEAGISEREKQCHENKVKGNVEFTEALKGGGEIGMSSMSNEAVSHDVVSGDLAEPYYENQLSMESDRKGSTSSASSMTSANGSSGVTISSCGLAGNGESPSERHMSGEESSVLQEVNVSETSGNSTKSSSSESSCESSTSESSSSAENTATAIVTEIRKAEQPTRRLDPDMVKKRQSNPDIRGAIEGPLYINAEAKPVTKPYKVVDISTGMLVREEFEEQSDTPPLPPKERELNQKKEEGSFDHYYCEPPEDIVPDYKKLTPLQNKEPAPELDMRKSPGWLKSLPVLRPRSQLHVSTLPRPIPRAKGARWLEIGDQTVRPASQVVTRTSRLDAPKPPSPSTIPTRKPLTGVSSPPQSPTDGRPQTPGSPEAADTAKENKDQGLKPKRAAPPPPVANQPASPTPKPSASESKQDVSPTCQAATSTKAHVQMRSQTLNTTTQSTGSKNSPKSGIKRALSSWKRLSGRRKGKRKLDISAPILVNEEIPSFAAQQDTLRKRASVDPSQPVCTSIRELNGVEDSSEKVQEIADDGASTAESSVEERADSNTGSPNVPTRRRGHSYQNFPFSKSGSVEKPQKPERPGRGSRPIQEVKPTEINPPPQQEDPAYLEPCKDDMTLKVEAALANLNDAQILAEALSRVEQEKLGPLPEVPKSRHVHFKFNATSGVSNQPAGKEGKPSLPKRPVRAVCPTLVNGIPDKGRGTESKPCPPKYPSRPPNTKAPQPSRNRSKSLGASHGNLETSESPRNRAMSIQNTTTKNGNNSTKNGNNSTKNGNSATKNRYNKILEMHIQTLQEVITSSRATLLPGDSIDLSSTHWGDYVVCGDPLTVRGPGAVLLPVKCTKVDDDLPLLARVKYPKAVTEDMSQRTAFMQDMSISVSLPSHVNISRTLTHFTDTLPGKIFAIHGDTNWETLVTVTDQLPVESMAEFVERTREEHEQLPDEYERKVIILLMQLFSALEHLRSEGIVHRDINMANLLLLNHGHLIVANFGQVLQQPKDNIPTRFVYNADNITGIVSDSSRLPPEIINGLSASETLDFEKCDVFAAGCLVYELLHEASPFSSDPDFVKSEYSIEQLPQFTERSRFTCGLGALASGLLERNPAERMLPKEALQLLQAFLWGPEELDDSCLEMSACDWLETERACAVVMIARSQSQSLLSGGEEFLENYLKYQYLVEVSEEEIINGYTALSPLDALNATI